MKYAILGDLHANLEALQSVVEDAGQQGVSQYACTGDLVGYNADPKACLKLIRSLSCALVQGNHDYYAASNESMELFTPMARRSIDWTRKQLSMLDRKFLRELPLVQDMDGFTLVHSSLHNPEQWNYIFKQQAAESSFRNQFSDLCFIGHTHVPLAFVSDGIAVEKGFYETLHIQPGYKYIVNVGSVGQPRDRNPLTAYAIYDTEEQTVTMRRLKYDIEATQKKVRQAGLPFRNALRLTYGR